MLRARAWAKIASRKKFKKAWGCIFFNSAASRAASRESACHYGGIASGELHLDTPRAITDTAGNVVWQWDNTDPFGNNVPNENPSNQGQFSFNLRFPGQYADKETGLNYNRFRDYDPALGAYKQSDLIGLHGGINTYAYVSGNPLRLSDPSGLCANALNPSQDCRNALLVAGADTLALARVNYYWDMIQQAADANHTYAPFLAAISIRESGFRNIPQTGGGLGRGIFQIDLGAHPSVTEAQAYDGAYAANYAANLLASDMYNLATTYPDFTPLQLFQATAAAYNSGTGNISGNPNTIDVGTTGDNYGQNVLDIMFNCFN